MRQKLLKCIDYFLLNREGFTFRVEGEGIDVPTEGYVVSVTPLIGLGEDVDVRAIILYTMKNREVEVCGRKHKTYMGGWYDEQEQEFVLDVSIVVDTKEEAMKIAKEANQKAIYDLDEEVEIFM